MSVQPLQLPISLAWGKGGYTVQVRLGQFEAPLNLVLDTGSSTLAILPGRYAPEHDACLRSGHLAQAVAYGAGALVGPVLRSVVRFGSGHHERILPAAEFVLVQGPPPPWQQADGLLGLAYRGLNTAHDASALLAGRSPPLVSTWPWPFQTASPEEQAAFSQELQAQPAVTLTPCFSALETEGIVADCFALSVRRAVVHVAATGLTTHQLAADPMNCGTLVLGGGVECASLYSGAFELIRIVHDLYYNAVLKSVRVGSGPEWSAPALEPQYLDRYCSNAIVDTGCSFIILPQPLFQQVLTGFAEFDPALPEIISRFEQSFASGNGLPNDAISHAQWPDLRFTLESADGQEVQLQMQPAHYWEANALQAGQSLFLLRSQLPGWPSQAILGLPLWCGRYCVFDRRAGTHGVLRIARARN